MTTGIPDTLDKEETEIKKWRIEASRTISSALITTWLDIAKGSTETFYVFRAAPPPEYEKYFRLLKDNEILLRELSESEEDWKKIEWSEDITERIDITTLASEYLKGNVVPSGEAEKRIRRLFDRVAENPPFPTVADTMKWLRGH